VGFVSKRYGSHFLDNKQNSIHVFPSQFMVCMAYEAKVNFVLKCPGSALSAKSAHVHLTPEAALSKVAENAPLMHVLEGT
jgi:hypothetical protein